MLTFPEASSPQWSLINSLWTFRAWCWPLAPTSLHAVSPWIFSFGQQAPGYQSILTVIWAVNYLQTAGAQKAHLKLKGFHTGLNLPHYNYDMLIKVISVSASSISDVRKQVGGIRDGRHHALSPQNEAGPDQKSSTPSGPDKTSLPGGPWLPAPSASPQVPAIFMTLSWKHQSHLKRSNNNAAHNTGMPYEVHTNSEVVSTDGSRTLDAKLLNPDTTIGYLSNPLPQLKLDKECINIWISLNESRIE